jgi:hypothetical protein
MTCWSDQNQSSNAPELAAGLIMIVLMAQSDVVAEISGIATFGPTGQGFTVTDA